MLVLVTTMQLQSCDDGTCCFENCVNVNLNDSFGDGWNGAIYSLIDVSSGTVITERYTCLVCHSVS
jgi:hypothetical protein